MLILLSPAKKLLAFEEPYQGATSQPVFLEKTWELVRLMKTHSPAQIAKLMSISSTLAALNYQRFQAFQPSNAHYPAVFLFQGDVYKTLNARQWDNTTLEYAQSHLLILSGLYGLLKPLDLIEPYRLEMGTRLANSLGSTLYDFWQEAITSELNRRLNQEKQPLLINLASSEYFSAVNFKKITSPILTIHFLESKNNQLKVIGIHAKKARGAMANYILQHRITSPQAIKEFNALNYRFCEQSSDQYCFNFIR